MWYSYRCQGNIFIDQVHGRYEVEHVEWKRYTVNKIVNYVHVWFLSTLQVHWLALKVQFYYVN